MYVLVDPERNRVALLSEHQRCVFHSDADKSIFELKVVFTEVKLCIKWMQYSDSHKFPLYILYAICYIYSGHTLRMPVILHPYFY